MYVIYRAEISHVTRSDEVEVDGILATTKIDLVKT